MRQPLKKRITAAVTGVLVALSTASLAMGPHGGDHDPARMLSHMSERLELSDGQREQVEAILEAGRAQSSADRQRLQELRSELMAMQSDFDRERAREIADEIGDITSRMVYQFASSFAEFHALLTDEQRAQLEQFREERGERRKERWHHSGE